MLDTYVFGWIICAALSAFAIRNFVFAGKKCCASLETDVAMCTENITTAAGECISSKRDGEVDVVIVGAGVAGSALAYTLGWTSSTCHLCEPDRIVGELLQPGGYLKLIELRLEDCVDKIDAQQVFGYALFKDGKHIRLFYPLEKFHSDVAGRSFHTGRFIQRVREKAASFPNVRLQQGTVTSLLEEKGVINGLQYKTKDGQELSVCAPFTIVCDGCFSNLCRSLCNPKVPHELHDAFITAVDKGSIRTKPNRSMPATPHPTLGALLMGDAFNMFSDIVVLRNLLRPLRDLNDAPNLCKYLESFYTMRKPVASTINKYAGREALYKVFLHHLIQRGRKCVKLASIILVLEVNSRKDQSLCFRG